MQRAFFLFQGIASGCAAEAEKKEMNVDKTKTAFKKGYRIIGKEVVNIKTGNVRKVFYYKAENGYSPYPRFTIAYNGKRISIWPHHLAAFQKFGAKKCSRFPVVRHKNNDILDFSISNILLGTQTDNMMDQPPDVRREKAVKASRAAKIRFDKYRYAVLEYMDDF
jgi:hypothetical protein